ncbi:MAG: hypothetical protein M1383_06110 [Patescibacteria group bacterium]|nr:hypothetical protein [Patescibacteria group bacterium]
MLNLRFDISYVDPETEEVLHQDAESKEEADQVAEELEDEGYIKININKIRT